MKLDDKLVRRAKDLAARKSAEAYVETLQAEVRSAVRATVANVAELVALSVDLNGTHVHEVLVMDGQGNAMLITAMWSISNDPKKIAAAVKCSRAEGRA